MLNSKEDLLNRFTYHPPVAGQAELYQEIRSTALAFATQLVEKCPPSRELSLALTHLEEVAFWANASIARNQI